MITVKKITAEETYYIRKEVLRKGIDLPYRFEGDFDRDTFHIGVFFDGDLVSVSSIMKNSNKMFHGRQYQLRGMATSLKARGKGCGKKMIDYIVQILQENNSSVLWCDAREVAVAFYEKSGLITFGESFLITQIGKHYLMYRKL